MNRLNKLSMLLSIIVLSIFFMGAVITSPFQVKTLTVGTSPTPATNIRLHRGATALQFVPASDATAEGSTAAAGQFIAAKSVVIGTSGTAASNYRLHRGVSTLQFVPASDATAEGSDAPSLSPISVGNTVFRNTSFQVSTVPAAGGATITLDALFSLYYSAYTSTVGGTTITLGATTGWAEGQQITWIVHNTSGSSLTVNGMSGFRWRFATVLNSVPNNAATMFTFLKANGLIFVAASDNM